MESWADSRQFWRDKRVIVPGGAGFLGSYVVEKLKDRGASEIVVPRSSTCDLRDINAVRKLLGDTVRTTSVSSQRSKVVVIHLAARVGGIGANRDHPAEFFYDNPMMGAHLLEDAAGGIFLAAERYDGGEPVNLGSVCEISIKEMVETIADAAGFTG